MRTGVIPRVLQGGLIEPPQSGIQLPQGGELTTAPELAREHRIIALDGGLGERLARHREHRNDLPLEQEHNEPGQTAFARARANRRLAVSHLHHIGIFKGLEEGRTGLPDGVRVLGFNPLKIPQFLGVLETEPNEIDRYAAPAKILLADKIRLQHAPAQGRINRMFRVTQIACRSLGLRPMRLGQPQRFQHPADGPQRRHRTVRITAPVVELYGTRSRIETPGVSA